MLKNITRIELQVGTRTYQFTCDMDSPLAEVKEAVFQLQKYIGQIEDQHRIAAEKKAQEESEKAAEQPAVDIQPE